MKVVKKNVWKPVEIDGAIFANGGSELIGIEECTEYDLDKILSGKKRKRKTFEVSNGSSKKQAKNEKRKKTNKLNEDISEEEEDEIYEENEDDELNEEDDENDIIPDIQPSLKRKKKAKKLKQVPTTPGKFVRPNIDDGDETQEEIDMSAWGIVPMPESILNSLKEQKFSQPTEIQRLTLPAAILGQRDILGAAETGSGKTLAFGIPILAGILKLKNIAENEEITELDETTENLESEDQVGEDENSGGEEEDLESEEEDLENEEEDLESEEEDMENEEEVLDSEEEDLEIDEELEGEDEDLESEDENLEDEEEALVGEDENLEGEEDVEGEDENSDQSDFEENEEDVNGVNHEGVGCVRSINNIQMPGVRQKKPLYALILTPTRELAVQIKDHLIAAAKYTGIRVAVVVGGLASVKQERVLSKGPEIVVATPGRLWELVQQGNEHLNQIDNIRYLAIDETDRMVERGHFQELHHILERINMDESKKRLRQNFVFSATLTLIHEIPRHVITKKKMHIKRRIADMTPAQKLKKVIFMLGITDPKIVDITEGKGTSVTLTECRITCSIDEKDFYVYYLLLRHPGRTLIFCNSIGCVKRLASLLKLLKCNPLPLHAAMQQRQRLKNLDRFKETKDAILIATDVAARGLDIPSVDQVIHYQTPRTSESYVHRSGRTARASKEGITILLVEPTELQNYLRLCRTLGKTEDIPIFPVVQNFLNAVKQRIHLARELDKLELKLSRTDLEKGWWEKASNDMDIIIDDEILKQESKEARSYRKPLEIKRKQLGRMLEKPIFPKGFSGKYPLSSNTNDLTLAQGEFKVESAVNVMKTQLENKVIEVGRKKPKALFKQKIKKTNEPIQVKQLMAPRKRRGGWGKHGQFRKNKKL